MVRHRLPAAATSAYAGGGFNDWFLPSRDELYQLYLNRAAIGGFHTSWPVDDVNVLYWSSSQGADYATYVWLQGFNDGLQDYENLVDKYHTLRVRAVRAF